MGHSMSDPLHGVYRTKRKSKSQRKPRSDLAARRKLKEEGVLDEAGLDALDAEGAGGGRGSAGASPIRARSRLPPSSPPTCWPMMATLTYRDALNQALREEDAARPQGVFSW